MATTIHIGKQILDMQRKKAEEKRRRREEEKERQERERENMSLKIQIMKQMVEASKNILLEADITDQAKMNALYNDFGITVSSVSFVCRLNFSFYPSSSLPSLPSMRLSLLPLSFPYRARRSREFSTAS